MGKVTSADFQAPANAMYSAIQQVLLTELNTIITGKIESVNSNDTYNVQPTLTYLNLGSNPTIPPVITNVPANRVRFGNAEIKGKYKVGDGVLLGIVQRDISIVKKMWNKITNPNSYRKFSLPDAIILGYLANDPASVFVELNDKEINIVAPKVNINAPETNITSSSTKVTSPTVTIDADNATVTASNITLAGNVNVSGSLSAAGGLSIGGQPYESHQHTAGGYQAPNGAVTGTSGAVI